MDDSFFLNEIHDYINQEFKEFSHYRNLVWELFCTFNDICHRENLDYFVAFGSLIGAIRDGGSIPWDYDMDVVMSIDERDRLITVLKKELPSSMYYVYKDNVRDYPTTCLRICKKGYPFTSIHLDIFFAIGCPNDNPEEFVKYVDRLHELRINKYAMKWFPDSTKSRLTKFIARLRSIKGCLITTNRLNSLEEKYNFKYKLSDSKYCCIVSAPYLKFYHTEDFKHTKQMTVNEQTINIPSGYDRYLRTIYGDYMEYLPVMKRFDEFYEMHRIVKERQRLMETTHLFDAFK